MHYLRKIISMILLLLWMITIFLFSAQPADESSRNSAGIVDRLVEWFVRDFDQLADDEQTDLINTLTVVVRKGAHMAEYAVLAVLIYYAVIAWNLFQSDQFRLLAALVGAALYAATDELHQRFVPGRSGELRDILIDSTGALLGIGITIFVTWIIRRNVRGVCSKKTN